MQRRGAFRHLCFSPGVKGQVRATEQLKTKCKTSAGRNRDDGGYFLHVLEGG